MLIWLCVQGKNAFCRHENEFQGNNVGENSGWTRRGEPVVRKFSDSSPVGLCVAEQRACDLFGILCDRKGNIYAI